MSKEEIIKDLSQGKSLTEIQKRMNLAGYKNSAISAILIELLSSSANSEGKEKSKPSFKDNYSEIKLNDIDCVSTLSESFRMLLFEVYENQKAGETVKASDLNNLKTMGAIISSLPFCLKN